MAATREIVQMLDANSRQAGYFGIGEDFLTRLNLYHCGPLLRFFLTPVVMHWWRIKDANSLSNSHSVLDGLKLFL